MDRDGVVVAWVGDVAVVDWDDSGVVTSWADDDAADIWFSDDGKNPPANISGGFVLFEVPHRTGACCEFCVIIIGEDAPYVASSSSKMKEYTVLETVCI